MGVPPSALPEALESAVWHLLKVSGVTRETAEVLKARLESAGGTCTIGRAEHRVLLLGGTRRQMREVALALSRVPDEGVAVAESISAELDRSHSAPLYRLSCGETRLHLGTQTRVMGILNVTPDSFSDGGRFSTVVSAVAHAETMAEDGADIIDVGGESSRPAGLYGKGAEPISAEEESRRACPVIEQVVARTGLPVSIDTVKAAVARRALDAGATMVNDISAMRADPEMPEVVSRAGVPVVLMHMQGTPKTMQQNPTYHDLMGEIGEFLADRRDRALASGILAGQIVLDPGLGFGKRYHHNFEIIARLEEFRSLGCPILVGPSRKGFVGDSGSLPPVERLEGTLSALALCVAGGAHIMRVHDVREAVRAVRVADQTVRPTGESPS